MSKKEDRLSKRMSQLGMCSRREADHLIQNGWVQVNGQIVQELGSKASMDDQIDLLPEARQWLDKKVTVAIYKPAGYVSGQAEKDYSPAIRLLTPKRRHPTSPPLSHKDKSGLAPVGRLDIDSKGLLILSQDGRLAKKIIGHQSAIEKEYLVWVKGKINPTKIKQLQKGLSLDGQILKDAQVEQIKPQCLKFILTQGKKRQIRRMCELVDLSVTGLKRVRIGRLKLSPLKEGQWRVITPEEVLGD